MASNIFIRRHSLLVLLLVLPLSLMGQIFDPRAVPPPSNKPAPKPPTTSSNKPQPAVADNKNATILLTWVGAGNVQIELGENKITAQPGNPIELKYKSKEAFVLKVMKPSKTYMFEDFLVFEKGTTHLTVDLVGEKLTVKTETDQARRQAAEQAKIQEANRIAEENRRLEEAKRQEAARIEEEKRKKEETRLAEEARLAEARRKEEEARLAEIKKKDEDRQAEEEAKKPLTILVNGQKIEVYKEDVGQKMMIYNNGSLSGKVDMNWNNSKNECLKLGDGWRLPTVAELDQMFIQLHKNGRGNFLNGFYWSGTEAGSNKAWIKDFENGNTFMNGKSGSVNVRPVRNM